MKRANEAAATVFHEGELHVQDRAGERDVAARNAAIVSHAVPEPAQRFIARQRMVALGGVGRGGGVWATAVLGEAGFASVTPDGDRVALRVGEGAAADPLLGALRAGQDVGMLAIELATRRRVRVHGTVRDIGPDSLAFDVRESYPNCPKYIVRRRPVGIAAPAVEARVEGEELDADVAEILERAETLFVASVHPTRGADASHRGGPAGFVRVVDGRTLRIPDYEGNGMYNTLGNLVVDARAGLFVPDFDRGRALHITGTATLTFDDASSETGRSVSITVARWVLSPFSPGERWAKLEAEARS